MGKTVAILSWTEPTSLKRDMAREARQGRKPDFVPWLIAVGLSAAMIVAMVSRKQPFLADSWPISVLVALLTPVGMLLGVAWLSSLAGNIVKLSREGINLNSLQGSTWVLKFWRWDKIERCAIEWREVGGKMHRVLGVYFRDGSSMPIGLAAKVREEEIVDAVEACGRPIDVVA